jgi:hypothetical protein
VDGGISRARGGGEPLCDVGRRRDVGIAAPEVDHALAFALRYDGDARQ